MDKKQIIISIIVPIYKVENYIEKCVLSILRQNYSLYEIIFVDDCSPDNSCNKLEKVLREYPKCACKIIHHEKNLGLAAARRSGIAAAQGEYILHVDSDDYLLPKALESFAYLLQGSTQPDIILGNFVHIYPRKQIVHCRNVVAEREELITVMIGRKESCNIWNNLIRRSLYDNLEIPAINNGEDYVTMPRLVYKAHKIIYNSVITYAYTHVNSSSFQFRRNSKDNLLDRYKACDYLLHYFQLHNASIKIMDSLYYAILCNDAVNLIFAKSIDDLKNILVDAKNVMKFRGRIKLLYWVFLQLRIKNRFRILLILGQVVRWALK